MINTACLAHSFSIVRCLSRTNARNLTYREVPPVLTILSLLAPAILAAFGKIDHARCDSTHSDHGYERNSSLLICRSSPGCPASKGSQRETKVLNEIRFRRERLLGGWCRLLTLDFSHLTSSVQSAFASNLLQLTPHAPFALPQLPDPHPGVPLPGGRPNVLPSLSNQS